MFSKELFSIQENTAKSKLYFACIPVGKGLKLLSSLIGAF